MRVTYQWAKSSLGRVPEALCTEGSARWGGRPPYLAQYLQDTLCERERERGPLLISPSCPLLGGDRGGGDLRS